MGKVASHGHDESPFQHRGLRKHKQRSLARQLNRSDSVDWLVNCDVYEPLIVITSEGDVMPKNAKKRTSIKGLSRPKQELTAKSAKKVKGGMLPLSASTETTTSTESRPGVGILRSTDGGKTW